jgi:Ni,Fe-hydrogenase III small subunit
MGEGMNSHQRAPTSIIGLLADRFVALFMTLFKRQPIYAEPILPPELARQHRSVFLRHLDCGSCNGCELELVALGNPIYDSERYGIKFEASPRHADALVLTGPMTRNLVEAARLTLEAMPVRRVVTIGDCTCERDSDSEKNIFRDSYAIAKLPEELQAALQKGWHVPGCPPTPEVILNGMITNDKFCLTRRGALGLSWWRRPLRLRNAAD